MYFGADGALVATSNTIKCTQLDGTRNMSSCRGACGAWGCRFTAPYLLTRQVKDGGFPDKPTAFRFERSISYPGNGRTAATRLIDDVTVRISSRPAHDRQGPVVRVTQASIWTSSPPSDTVRG